MADLFVNQAGHYVEGRPSYPLELFQFIASKTPCQDFVWDVGTGNGQAARSLAGIYKNVIATDTSSKQLSFAPRLPNIRYQQTPPTIAELSTDWEHASCVARPRTTVQNFFFFFLHAACMGVTVDVESKVAFNINSFLYPAELESKVAPQSSVDVVTVAQAFHWFDLSNFYQEVKWVLKKPNGVIAPWCYTSPEVNESIDSVFQTFYNTAIETYWEPARKLLFDKYRSIDFPFEPVDGVDHTGPFEFVNEKLMDLDHYFTYMRSLASYQKARENGVEFLSDDVVEDFKRAWTEDGQDQKVVKFPVYLRIGRVGNM